MSIRLGANYAPVPAPRYKGAGSCQPGQRRMRIAIGAVMLLCGFIPAGESRADMPMVQHARQGDAVCGWIGVRVSPMTRAFADSLGMAEPYGAIFDQPEPGSPAAVAGIEVGDVVTAVNGAPLTFQRFRHHDCCDSAEHDGHSQHIPRWPDDRGHVDGRLGQVPERAARGTIVGQQCMNAHDGFRKGLNPSYVALRGKPPTGS